MRVREFVSSLSCLVNTDYNIKLRTPLGVRLGLGEQPFSFGYDWRVIGGRNPT